MEIGSAEFLVGDMVGDLEGSLLALFSVLVYEQWAWRGIVLLSISTGC